LAIGNSTIDFDKKKKNCKFVLWWSDIEKFIIVPTALFLLTVWLKDHKATWPHHKLAAWQTAKPKAALTSLATTVDRPLR
jgi:hypothetical protein